MSEVSRRILCPTCQTVLALPKSLPVGKRLACPKCKTIVDPATAIDAPAPSTSSSPPPASLDLDLPDPAGGSSAAQSTGPAPSTSPQPAKKSKSTEEHVPISCLVCGTRYYALASAIGSQAKCPDCFSLNEVRRPAARPKQTLGPGLNPLPAEAHDDIPIGPAVETPAFRPLVRGTPTPEKGVGPLGRGGEAPLDLNLPEIPPAVGPPQFADSGRPNNPVQPVPVQPGPPPAAKPPVELVDPMVQSVALRRAAEAQKLARDSVEDDDDFQLSAPVERTGFNEKFAQDLAAEATREPNPMPPGAGVGFNNRPVPPPVPGSIPSRPSPPVPPQPIDTTRWKTDDPAIPPTPRSDDPLDLERMAQALPAARVAPKAIEPPPPPVDNDPTRGGIALSRGMTVGELAQKYNVEPKDDFDPYSFKFELPKAGNWLLFQPKVMVRWLICSALIGAWFAMFSFASSKPPEDSTGVEIVVRQLVGVVTIMSTLVVFGYLANVCYFLAEMSANDHKTVDEWPGVGPVEAGMNAFFIFAGVFWSGVGMSILAAVVHVMLGTGLLGYLVWPCVFVLFPPVYVSMLEGGGVSSPMTQNVWRVFQRRRQPWIAHYMATVGYFFAMSAAVALFIFMPFSLTYLLAGVVVSGGCLLYFEQLGKLARFVNESVAALNAEDEARAASE